MEFRVLKYFLAVAREESFVRAAESLHVTQPTLSRQIQDLEDEFGKQLFVRGSRRITLTEEGMLFRKRAVEICSLVEMARNEIADSCEEVAGDIFIGAGEASCVRYLAETARQVQKNHPNVHFHISSGDGLDIADDLNKGLLDFALVFSPFDTTSYNSLEIGGDVKWGILMRNDNPLAKKEFIETNDLYQIPLILSRQMKINPPPVNWLGKKISELNEVGTYSLVYNVSLFVQEGFASALIVDGILNLEGTNMTFVPLRNQPNSKINIVWKKYQVMTKASEAFLAELQKSKATSKN